MKAAEGAGASVRRLLASILLAALLAPCLPAVQDENSRSALPADSRFKHSRLLVEQGRFKEAEAELKELQRSFPNSALLLNLLGFCDLQQGLRDLAIQNFHKAV